MAQIKHLRKVKRDLWIIIIHSSTQVVEQIFLSLWSKKLNMRPNDTIGLGHCYDP